MRRINNELNNDDKRLKSLIPNGKRNAITSTELINKFWGKKDQPFYARSAMLARLRILERKLAATGKILVLTGYGGPKPMQIWIQRAR
jgi:hypothetical protein